MKTVSFLLICLFIASTVGQVPLFQDDFDTEQKGTPPTFWTSQPYCKVTNAEAWSGTKSVVLRGTGYMQNSVSTLGYQSVYFGYFYKVNRLESTDTCVSEYSTDNGSTWTNVAVYTSAINGNNFQNGGSYINSLNNLTQPILFRFRANMDSSSTDDCYIDAVIWNGIPIV